MCASPGMCPGAPRNATERKNMRITTRNRRFMVSWIVLAFSFRRRRAPIGGGYRCELVAQNPPVQLVRIESVEMRCFLNRYLFGIPKLQGRTPPISPSADRIRIAAICTPILRIFYVICVIFSADYFALLISIGIMVFRYEFPKFRIFLTISEGFPFRDVCPHL